MIRISFEALLAFHRGVLDEVGLDEHSREAVAMGLCETSLRGVDSHGVRLLPHYVRSALAGRKNPRPNFQFTATLPTIGLLDADNAFGHAAGMKAIDHCVQMAREYGTGAVGVANSSHCGAMASFALKAARQGYLAFAFTHADSLLLSHDGTRPYFGTNPVCFAAPRKKDEPYCLDMATSVIPWNKILLHRADGTMLARGVAADEQATPTTDPMAAAYLAPIGTYKGFGLASMVEILCSVFTGMNFGRHIPSMYGAPIDQPRRLGQFYMVLRIDGCVSASTFLHRMQQLTDEVRNEPSQPGTRVKLSGDPQTAEANARKHKGIPLSPDTVRDLRQLADQFNVPFEPA